MELVSKITHHLASKQRLRIFAGIVVVIALGLWWQQSPTLRFSTPINPPSAQAYCSGGKTCGSYTNVCGSCPEGSCVEGYVCSDGSTCPCGPLCYPEAGNYVMCSGGSQSACMSASCGGGSCHADGACNWYSGSGPTPTPLPGSAPPPGSTCVNCGHRCATGQSNDGGGNVYNVWEDHSQCNCGMTCAG